MVFFFIMLSSSTCRRENEDCHFYIFIENKSSDDIIVARKFFYDDLCKLSGEQIEANEKYSDYAVCWERRLMNEGPEEFYIVDPANYNMPSIYYNCDSIAIKNTILKHYILTLEDLQAVDFEITYP